MQAERAKILLEIDELDKQRCDLCAKLGDNHGAVCECPAAVKVRKLGQEIIKHTNPRNIHEFEMLAKVGIENLTEDIYRHVKEEGLKETEIAKALNTKRATLYDWRRDNGLLNIGSVEV